MITRNSPSGFPCGAPKPPTDDEVKTALRRLRTDFAFIGITDKWDLSICLFSKMFNTSCHPYQFYNTRPGVLANKKAYKTQGLRGFVDEADGQLYAEATLIFQENMAKHNVNMQTCQACFDQR